MIAGNGEPLVKLVPVPKATERKPRVPGRWKGQIWIGPDCFNEIELARTKAVGIRVAAALCYSAAAIARSCVVAARSTAPSAASATR